MSQTQPPEHDPFSVQKPTVFASGESTTRPTGVTVIAIICLLIGIVGLLSGLMAMAGLFFGQAFAEAFTQPGEAAEVQRQMNAEMSAVTKKFFWFTLPLSVIGMIVSGCMVSGGIGLLGSKEWARVLLRRVLLGAIVFEFARAVVYVLTQLEIVPIMQTNMKKIAGAGGGPGGEMMGQMMGAMMIVGMGLWAVWMLSKVGMMFFGAQYLNRDATKVFFAKSE